jgi:RNA polymerase sigma-70 factor (ECF subfamily)
MTKTGNGQPGRPEVAGGGPSAADADGRFLYLVSSQPRPEREDRDLVAAFLRADPGSSEALWNRYYPIVRRVACRAFGPGLDVDDIVQEVFVRLFRKLPTLRDVSALRPFILSITMRVIQTELRLRWVKRWLGLFDGGEPPDHAGDDADFEAREALARFYRILDGLGPKHRAAFVLRHVEGLELVEVASAIGVSLATIKRWLPRIARRVFAQAGGDPLLAPYLERMERKGTSW